VHHRVRLRPDGLIEISRASWRQTLVTRNPCAFAGLLVACVTCISLLVSFVVYVALKVQGLLAASLLFGAFAVVFMPAVWAAGLARSRPPRSPRRHDPADFFSERARLRPTPQCQCYPTNAGTTPP
jgi:hypothetical protein